MQVTTRINRTLIGEAVDHLGKLKAAISDLSDDAETSKAVIIEAASASGEQAFEGSLFRATVSFTDKTVTDYKAVIAFLVKQYKVAPHDLEFAMTAATRVAEGLPVVRVSARKA